MQEILLKSWTNPYINTIFWNKYIHLSNLFTSCYKILSSITLMIFFFHVITSYERILFWTRTHVSSQLFWGFHHKVQRGARLIFYFEMYDLLLFSTWKDNLSWFLFLFCIILYILYIHEIHWSIIIILLLFFVLSAC